MSNYPKCPKCGQVHINEKHEAIAECSHCQAVFAIQSEKTYKTTLISKPKPQKNGK